MKRYSEILEAWEQESYAGHYGADWLENVGESVKFYAQECEASGRRPTFSGLIDYLSKIRQSANEERERRGETI